MSLIYWRPLSLASLLIIAVAGFDTFIKEFEKHATLKPRRVG